MPSVAEITSFKVSEDYKAGSASLTGPLSGLRKVAGLKQSYVGHETEDASILFWVNDWVTKDVRDAFAKKANYAEIAAASRPAFGAEPTVHYVEFEDTKALGAPITEFVTFTLREGSTIAQLDILVQEIHEKLAGTPKFHGDSWAPIIDKPNIYHGILGWDTVQAHWDAVSGGPLKDVIDRIRLVADIQLVHAALERFSG